MGLRLGELCLERCELRLGVTERFLRVLCDRATVARLSRCLAHLLGDALAQVGELRACSPPCPTEHEHRKHDAGERRRDPAFSAHAADDQLVGFEAVIHSVLVAYILAQNWASAAASPSSPGRVSTTRSQPSERA